MYFSRSVNIKYKVAKIKSNELKYGLKVEVYLRVIETNAVAEDDVSWVEFDYAVASSKYPKATVSMLRGLLGLILYN